MTNIFNVMFLLVKSFPLQNHEAKSLDIFKLVRMKLQDFVPRLVSISGVNIWSALSFDRLVQLEPPSEYFCTFVYDFVIPILNIEKTYSYEIITVYDHMYV